MNLLSNYDFYLPKELIATVALKERGASKLLCLLKNDSEPRHDLFKNIGNYLREGDCLVVNNTKVRKARIFAAKKTGGRVEILLVRPLDDGRWLALINGKGPFLPNTRLNLGSAENSHEITIIKKSTEEPGHYFIEADVDLGPYAEQYGELPLPPYFQRRAEKQDEEDYQTIFAKELGAVASPTAGLHFTRDFLEELKARGINIVETTLHVGPGTFLPIRTDNILDHKMHAEYFAMDQECAQTLNRTKQRKGRIIPVGTTSMRVLEQVMKWAHEKGSDQFFACENITSLFIHPGYEFLACNALITNFHLPRSTLLLLVCAVAGRKRVLSAYNEAVNKKYRFFSYGDACFFEI